MGERAIVVGAGVLGLAHAWHLHRMGVKVTVIERSPRAVGASIRNFGMIWPVGHPNNEFYDLALQSRSLWKEVLDETGIWHRECGSLHLAYHDDERQVMQESIELTDRGEWISADQVLTRFPAVRGEGLLGALFSPTEICVDPRTTVAELATALEHRGVQFRFGEAVTAVDRGRVTTASGQFEAEEIFVCTGPDVAELFPAVAREAGLIRCRLQMLRLAPVGDAPPLGIHLCAGLTLLHYANFRDCPTLPALRERFQRELPEHLARGIHILVSEHGDGTLTVGDSHQYDDAIHPYRDETTDQLILDYLNTFLPTSRYRVIERWDGYYNTHASRVFWHQEVGPGIMLANVFGTGMSLSMAVAKRGIDAKRMLTPA